MCCISTTVSAAVHLPLCIRCCVSAAVYPPLCISCCVSWTTFVYPPLWICTLSWYCISSCISVIVYISAMVYLPLSLLCCISAAVSAAVYPLLLIWRCYLLLGIRHWYPLLCICRCLSATVYPFIYQRNLKFAGDGRVAPAVANGGWRVKICEWVYTNDSVHSPILSSIFDGILTTCRSSGYILSQHVDIRHCTRHCIWHAPHGKFIRPMRMLRADKPSV